MSRTLLLGLDGATFTLLDPLMEAGAMPFLQRFTAAGVRAELLSTPCPVTPPAWTTVMTGRTPGNHGVFDFIRVGDEIKDRVAFRLANGGDIRCETLWSIVARQGRLGGVLNYPATFQLPPFNGYVVPGFVTSRLLGSATRPREFWDRVKQLEGFDAKDAAWDLDEGRKPLGRGLDDKRDFMEWIDYLERKEKGWFAIALELIEGTACDLVAVIFEGADRLQHQAWYLLDPACRPPSLTDGDRKLHDNSMDYFRTLDGLMQRLVEAAGSDSRVLMVSDHGFGPTREILYANVWLERHGYLTWKHAVKMDADGMLTAHNMREHFATIDWSRTRAYARTTSANGIYIRVANHAGQTGVRPEQYQSFRAKLADDLLAFRHPETNTPVITKIVTREEAFPGVAMDEAPDLTLTLRDHGFISILRGPHVLKRRDALKGTHRPEGVLIAGGKQIRRGVTLGLQSILDIAPTCLYSLGLPIPADFEGRVITDLFEPAFVAANPVRIGAPTIPPDDSAGTAAAQEMDAASEDSVLERLKALGYMG